MNRNGFILKRFLLNNGVYEKFVNNLFNMRKMTFNDFVDTCSHLDDISDMISRAFAWRNSQEGYSFWINVSYMARKYYITITRKFVDAPTMYHDGQYWD